MDKNKDAERVRMRELLLDRYVLALDEGDAEKTAAALEAVYEVAFDDPEVDRLIGEITRAYREEQKLTPLDADANLVRRLLREHVPSAFTNFEHLKRSLTVGEVAGWLQAQGRVPPGDEKTNRSLLGNSTPLPKLLISQRVKQLAAELGVTASQFYWRIFRDAAITMGIARSNSQVKLAAREQRAHRRARRDNKKRES